MGANYVWLLDVLRRKKFGPISGSEGKDYPLPPFPLPVVPQTGS